MGMIEAGDAYMEVLYYTASLNSMKDSIKKNFADMDFENADKKTDMEVMVNEIVSRCEIIIQMLQDLYFEY